MGIILGRSRATSGPSASRRGAGSPNAEAAQVVELATELATALDKIAHGPAGGTIVGIYRYPNEERRPTGFGAGHNGAGPH